jgi:hypothetical protein
MIRVGRTVWRIVKYKILFYLYKLKTHYRNIIEKNFMPRCVGKKNYLINCKRIYIFIFAYVYSFSV